MKLVRTRSRAALGLLVVAAVGTAGEAAAKRSTRGDAPRATVASPRAKVASWLRAHAPRGADVIDTAGEPLAVLYETQLGDTLPQVARALVGLSTTYAWDDFAEELVKANPKLRAGIQPGMRLTVPNLVDAAHATDEHARLGWPADGQMRGLYVRGSTGGGHAFPQLLDHMVDHGINAIVLDTKDTDGLLTYPSKVPLAVRTGAAAHAPIGDLARTIRLAHARGIRVIMRVSCFHDEWIQHHEPSLSVRGKWGGVYPIGWLDPSNEGAQAYIVALAKEAIDAGADEVQLDYVRYPVNGIHNADFHLEERKLTRTEVIRDFVRRVHTVTKARGVPLSLDVFGVIAEGKREDIDRLGQDVALLAPECEVLSPMVYPSHYAKGFMGFEVPGNHPELVGVGTHGTVTQIVTANAKTLVRPWVQAVNYESPDYGPPYLAAELKSAMTNGADGWLMWNPAQHYGDAWQAVGTPKRGETSTAKKAPNAG